MIDLQTLTISYGKKVLVDSVNAEFAPGTVYGLVAPNGHGKTTLLRAMAGLPGPRVDGSIVLDEVQGTGAREVRSMIFYAPGEGTLLYPGLRAEDHLKMVCDMWPHARDIEEIVEQTQIGEFAKMRIRALSQGMKQQLTLAIAYATGARYLLLDEPMNALDPSRVDLHSEILRKLADSGTCIIMSSHILDSVVLVLGTDVGVARLGRRLGRGPGRRRACLDLVFHLHSSLHRTSVIQSVHSLIDN